MFKILSTCKGGGYMYCRTDPPHPRANSNGLYPLHRVLAENKIGRLLEPGEISHHKDENKSNNDPSNLEVVTRSAHSAHHAKTVEPVVTNCYACGVEMTMRPYAYRIRVKRSRKGAVTCSRACGRKMASM